MDAKTVLIVVLVIALIAVPACVREPQVCNFDSICSTPDETDDCQDCKAVLDRGMQDPESSTPSSS